MSYMTTESSKYDSSPIELYEFKGTFRNYYLTASATSHEYGGNTYTPLAMLNRSSIELASQNEDQRSLEVTLPTSSQLVRDYGLQDAPPELTLTIYRLQRDTGDAIIHFRGEVKEIKIETDVAKLTIPSRFRELLSEVIPTIYVQPQCNHILFDQRCKVIRAQHSHNTTISLVFGRQVRVDSIGAFPDKYFVGGEVLNVLTGDRRTITAQSMNDITVNYEFLNISVGTAIEITGGCDHSHTGAGGCPKYNNTKNFGGFPYVPGPSNNVFKNGVK